MKDQEPKTTCRTGQKGQTDSETKGYGAYQKELKGGNIGPAADEGATGDAGVTVGGGLGVGKNTAGLSDDRAGQKANDVNEDVPRP